MRFIGFIVGNKKFGCGQRKEAEKYAAKTNQKMETWTYKI